MVFTLTPVPLTAEAFRSFGDVIDTDNASRQYPINNGTTQRYHDIGRIDCVQPTAEDSATARTIISVFRGQPRQFPFKIEIMERHPLGSQMFIPWDTNAPFLVVVAVPGVEHLLAISCV